VMKAEVEDIEPLISIEDLFESGSPDDE
jgi:hypothetical protein